MSTQKALQGSSSQWDTRTEDTSIFTLQVGFDQTCSIFKDLDDEKEDDDATNVTRLDFVVALRKLYDALPPPQSTGKIQAALSVNTKMEG